jgi:alpha-tubulin suppressor-like RCC1 family protein
MAQGITIAGSVVIGSGVGIPFDNIAATAVTGTKTIFTGVSQNFSTIDVAYGMAPITYAISPSLSITGLTFNTGNGNITGTATSTTGGISYAVTATDQYSRNASASFTLVVNAALTTTQVIASRTVTAGVNETGFTPVTYSGGTAPVTLDISPSITSLGLSFNTTTGAISGNATSTISATVYTITANDSASQSSSKTFTMTVAAPAFSTTQAIASRTLTAGTADSFTPVTATGGYGTKVWGISPALPSGLSLNTTNGLISGTPTINSSATTYTVTVTDGLSQSSSKTFSMTVSAPAITTTLAISSRSLQVGTADSFTPVTATGGYSTLTWSISPALPSGLSLDTSNGLISGTPAVSSASTSYSVTVTDVLSTSSSKSFTMDISAAALSYTIYDTLNASSESTTYVDPSNTLYSWGVNTFGGLGDYRTINRSRPIQVAASWAIVRITSVAPQTSVGIKSDGTLWAWGSDNNAGLLGNSTTNVVNSSPTQIGVDTNWSQISVGLSHIIAVKSDKTAYAWGLNTSGQLGVNDNVNRSEPTQVDTSLITNWNEISAGHDHTTAIDSLGSLYGWGNNNVYQTGVYTGASSWVQVAKFTSGAFVEGNIVGAAIKQDGTLWVWGSNSNGVLGLGTATGVRSSITQVGTDTWSAVSVTYRNMLAVRSDGTLWAWGSNLNSALGQGIAFAQLGGVSSPIQVGTDNDWSTQIITYNQLGNSSSGADACLAIKRDGSLWGWGDANSLPDGATFARSLPTLVGGAASWVFVSGQHAIKSDRTLWGWGTNSIGQIGDGTTTDRTSMIQVGASSWNYVTAGTTSATTSNITVLGITTAGTLFAWGSNASWQLGTGASTTTHRSAPIQVGALTNWSTASVSGYYSYALNTLGQMFAWGSGTIPGSDSSGIGDGSALVTRSSPVQIGTGTSFTAIASKGNGLGQVAISNIGGLWGWGGRGGYIGDNTTLQRSSPTLIRAASGTAYTAISTPMQVTSTYSTSFSHVAAGQSHSLAISSTGRLYAWGLNTSGQLGVRDTINRSFLTGVNNDSWTIISSGGASSYGIKNNNTLWAWGLGTSGQLGYGTAANRSSPIQIGTGSWFAISSGVNAAAAINDISQIFEWGINTGGARGDGTTTSRSSPVLVRLGSLVPLSTGQVLGMGTANTSYIKYGSNYNYSLFNTGNGALGAIGDNTTISKSSPVQLGTGFLDHWYAIAAIQGTGGLGIKNNGTLWVWGGNAGQNNAVRYSSPVQIGTNSNWSIVSSGSGDTFGAINTAGQLFAWGLNNYGQLGLGDTISRSSPVQIAGSWTAVAFGPNYVGFAINSTFKLFSWGNITFGQLGDYATADRSSPVQIGTSSWTQIAATSYGALAIRSDSTLWTWGYGGFGTLGLSTDIANRSSPTQIGTSSWLMVASSGGGSFAIRLGNTLWAWGHGPSGQLGIGDTINRSSPVQIGSATNWTNIEGANARAIALNSSHEIYVWGSNTQGALGIGDTINRSSPVLLAVAA